MFKLRFSNIFVFIYLFAYVGCSDVKFESIPVCESLQNNGPNVECSPLIEEGMSRIFDSQRAGVVDLLFVVDNSGSMYEEQTIMADQFPHFLSSIERLNYQIAIITTDVSATEGNTVSRPANGERAFQDGQFLNFRSGLNILSNNISDAKLLFQNTIKREETKLCDDGLSECPSGDERGIYAVNMAIDRGNSQFFRAEAHFAVIILSDEDERSKGGNGGPGRLLEPYDLPSTLVQKVNSQLGSFKSLSVHTVIIPPGDTACYESQKNSNGWNGNYGNIYSQLARPSAELKTMGNIVDGNVGSICAPLNSSNDSKTYGRQLGDIADKIAQNVNSFNLVCAPVNADVDISFYPEIDFEVRYEINEDNRLVLTPAVPAGIDVQITYNCAGV